MTLVSGVWLGGFSLRDSECTNTVCINLSLKSVSDSSLMVHHSP